MADLSKRRVYVMDCGDFVKIGVSCSAELRRNQIPYKVSQYYCTEPIGNAFEIENCIHKILRGNRADGIQGREYFNIEFQTACNLLKAVVDSEDDKMRSVIDSLDGQPIDKSFVEFICALLVLPKADLLLLRYVAEGLEARQTLLKHGNVD